MNLKSILVLLRLNRFAFLANPLAAFILSTLFYPSSAIAASPVFYQTQAKDLCTWTTLDLEKNQETVVLKELKSCSPAVFFNKKTPMAYALSGQEVYQINFGPSTIVKKLAKIPVSLTLSEIVIFKNGNLRVGHLIPVQEKDIVTQKDKKTYYRYKGKLYLDDTPPIGSPAIAEILELKNGKFETVHVTSTQFESEGTPGLLVALDQLESHPDFVSITKLLSDGSCGEQDCTDLKGWNAKAKGLLKKTLGLDKADDDSSSDEPAFVSLAEGKGLALQVIWGDASHFSPPVSFCDKYCEKTVAVAEVDHEQLSVQKNESGFFLLGEEFTGNSPYILKFDQAKPIKHLKGGLHAVWLKDISYLAPEKNR